ncbi:hypothetical protein [Desulfogranum japonicum]|uniref:hypothetical protein n=1 Tax=Desulfogranum japonicum TaxID=231447 RepID=UPI000414A739|nr:hypothetical protein [Desulfogranum japonicum]
MNRKQKLSLTRWMRTLHRDIGFFVVGLTIIYCVSGVLLTYRDTGFLKSEILIEKTLKPGLAANTLGRELRIRDLKVTAGENDIISFATGSYNTVTGIATYTASEHPYLLRLFNNLHHVSSKDGRHWFTTLYAIALLFLALSSFWMYIPGNSHFKRGLLISFCGILFCVPLLLL